MATEAPSVSQHFAHRERALVALKRANAIRGARAKVKRDLASGATTVRDVLKVHDHPWLSRLEDVDPALAGITIGELLGCPHRWGPARVAKLLADVHIPEARLVGTLTERRRRMIVAAFEGHLAETSAEAQRKAQAARLAAEQAAARARVEAERAAAAEAERRARVDAAFAEVAAQAPRPESPLDVACPECRSGRGDVCSTYDPVRDRWTDHPASCAARRERFADLAR